MQKNVVANLHIGNATGRNILAGVLKRIKDRDGCTIRIACGNDDFRRLSGFASAVIADASANIEILQSTIVSGKPVVLLNDWRFKEQPPNLGISRTLLDLRFREMESRTVGELITERKMSVLSMMLQKSKIPPARLTKECGFGNIKHAKAIFKKRFGMTMREWRNSFTDR